MSRELDIEEAAAVTGCTKGTCRELLENRYMRADGAPRDHLTVREATLLAAAKRCRFRGDDRRRFFVVNRNQPLLDGPVTMVVLSTDSVQAVDATKSFFFEDLPDHAVVFDNRELLARIAALPPRPQTLF